MKLLTRDHLLTILQTRTQAEAARFLGIGERTIRRIKNEPDHKTIPRVSKVVAQRGRTERNKLRYIPESKLKTLAQQTIKNQHRDSVLPKHPKGEAEYELPDLPIVPPSERATILDPSDKTLKTRMWSKSIVYNVQKISVNDILNLIKWYREKPGFSYRIVYQVPKGGASINGGKYPKAGHSGTTWELVSGYPGAPDSKMSDSEIYDSLLSAINCYPKKRDQGKHNILNLFVMGDTTGFKRRKRKIMNLEGYRAKKRTAPKAGKPHRAKTSKPLRKTTRQHRKKK